ncbi:uncharacterized protein LOC100908076 [Galendromus occidentalis]|uniref:Uncharacterized protein LOC100908076 n=1 Tax=Galendromus occidentalis TaxID=34638 RepID=A0AAJ6QS85_9ACAR|nr:uncharacterized protein LOC100908076 [Galendromus occidentalis]
MRNLEILLTYAAAISTVRAIADSVLEDTAFEAEEYMRSLIKDHLRHHMIQSESNLNNFSCIILREYTGRVAPVGRDLNASVTEGIVKGPITFKAVKCRSTREHPAGHVSFSCLIETEPIEVEYSATVSGYDFLGRVSKVPLKAKSDFVFHVRICQDASAQQNVEEIISMMLNKPKFERNTFKALDLQGKQQSLLQDCLTYNIQKGLDFSIKRYLTDAFQSALDAMKRALPTPTPKFAEGTGNRGDGFEKE